MAMAVDSPVQRVLDRLPSAKRSGDGWIALCPAHDDHKRSLGVKEYPDGHVSLKCFAGCRKEDVLDALHLGKRDLSANRGRGVSSTSGKGRNRATAKLGHERGKNRETVAQGVASSATSATAEGLTLADLAEAKHLPPDFLRKLGLTDIWYANQRVVRIPYTSEAGEVVAVRFRLSLDSDQNFAWRSGDKVSLYGLERLSHVRDCGWVLIVEGESDCWTCWHHGLPALGVPGKSTWRRQWADYLKGLHVYVWCEPNAEDFALGVGQDLPQAHAISAPDGVKDLSEAHIQGMDVSTLVESLRREAEPLEELRARLTSADIAEVKARARTVLECEDPVTYVKSAIRTLGFGGDITPPTVTYLAATSRVLAIRPGAILVHLLLTGQSSAGKSFILGIVKRLLPPEGYHEIDAGSPRVLIYDESELKHRVLIFGEADSLPAGEDNPAASAIRNLLQDHYLHYQVTVKSKETGDYSVRSVEKDGPTVLITTSTRPLGSQLSTRLFTLEVTDSHEQIRAALGAWVTSQSKEG